jgi:glyoxylase-like metal-dependent hydrolase (beta-lactamase superfamily II)
MIRIIEVSDGSFDYPREALLPPDAPAPVLAAYPPVFAVPYRPLIVDAGGMLVLLDTGAGPLGPSTGQIHDRLAANGMAPEDIGMVVLSHAHADHIGGLIRADGSPAFPNARIVIAREEYEFWRNSGILDQLGSGAVYGNAGIECVIRDWFNRYLLPFEARLELVSAEAVVTPGIQLIPAPGHTPGHSAVLIRSDDSEPVLFTADAFALAEHVANPEWTSSFDLDRSATVETRYRLMELAATENYRVIHYHISSPGRVSRRGDAFEWMEDAVHQRAGSRANASA